MTDFAICTVYLWVDADGEFVAHHDEDEAHEMQADNLTGARRLVAVNVKVPLPEMVEVDVTAPADPSQLEPVTA